MGTETAIEMPKFLCKKEVWALKIKRVYINHVGKTLLIMEDKRYAPIEVSKEYVDKHEPKSGGYYVVYKGGYKSFSPAEPFEEGYDLVINRQLQDKFAKVFESVTVGQILVRKEHGESAISIEFAPPFEGIGTVSIDMKFNDDDPDFEYKYNKAFEDLTLEQAEEAASKLIEDMRPHFDSDYDQDAANG